MIYSLIVYASPYSSQGSRTALRFAESLLTQGHELYRVFFYSDGVNNSNHLHTPPQDELDIPNEWKILADKHSIDMVVCIAAALRRGILDAKEASRYEKDNHNCAAPFEISGLGQMIDASVQSDRVITFG